MFIYNMNCKYNEQELDLSKWFAGLAVGRYIITQTIIDCKASYIIYDKVKGQIVTLAANHRVYLRDMNNIRISYTMKEVVRTVYDAEYCVDDIQDLDGEEWFFVDDWALGAFRHSNNTYLVSNYARVKSYAGYKAVLMVPKPKENGYYTVTFRREGEYTRLLLHRVVAYYFLLPLMPEGMDFSKCEVHHWKSKADNEVWNIQICTSKQQHMELDRMRRERERLAAQKAA